MPSAMDPDPEGPPEVSVVIPMRDAEMWIGAQLEALAAQELDRAWEVIVVDNASTDGSVAVVETWRDRLPHLQVVSAPFAPSAAMVRNVGMFAARGRLLAFSDADDAVSPGWLASIVDGLSHSDLVSGPVDVTSFNAESPLTWGVESRHGLPVAYGFLPFIPGCNGGIRREVFEALGGFDGYAPVREDVDISWRAQLAGFTLASVRGAVVRRRLRSTSAALFRQHLGYGMSGAGLYRRFRSAGMARSTVSEALKELGFLVLRSYRLRDRGFRRFWVAVAGHRAGQILGSLRYRVLFL